MRFIGVPTVILAMGVSAVAGHSYHAFEHGYAPVTGYGVLQNYEGTHRDSHAALPYEDFREVPTYYDGIEDFHQEHGYISYSEPHDDHHDHELLDEHRYRELHDYGHQDHHEHHENYVVHDNQEHHDHNEELEHQNNHEIYEHHGNPESYEHQGNNEQGHHVSYEQHEDEKHDYGHVDDEHDSDPNYEFKYGVNDPKTGDVKEQWESRAGDKVKGGYALKEADGTTRIVHYSADKKTGFEATVHKIGSSEGKHSEHDHYGH